MVRASPLPSDGAIPASIAWRAKSWGALNATHNVATVTNGWTSSSPNSPLKLKADSPSTANSAKQSAHTTGHSSTPNSACSQVRATHDVSGSGQSAIASPPDTNSSASTVEITIFDTTNSSSTTTAATAAIEPTPSVAKFATSAAASSLVSPPSTPGATSSACVSRLPATHSHSNTRG